MTRSILRSPAVILPPPSPEMLQIRTVLARRPRPVHRPAPLLVDLVIRVVRAVRTWARSMFVSWSLTGVTLAVSGARGPPEGARS